MVKRHVIRLLTCSLALFVGDFSHARTVSSLSIDAAGQVDKSLQNEFAASACKKFRPTKAQVIRFFNRAYPVEAYVTTNDRYSPCYATGALRFSDGSFGQWVLYSSGTAMFTFNKGDVVYLLHKQNKWHDPNACTYGVGDTAQC